MTSWCFAFPYCPNEPIREQAWEIVSAFYEKHFPDIPQLVHSATLKGEPFLRARTRNELVKMADRFDIVVLIDADTLIHPDGIHRMIEQVADEPKLLGKPFMRGVNRPLDIQRQIADLEGWPRPRFNDPGAAWVIRPETWRAAGGMDENFRSWGGEDQAHQYLHAAVGGTIAFDRLPAVKTEHHQQRWRENPEWVDTLKREEVCAHIYENPHLAAEWLTVRDMPGIVDEWMTTYQVTSPRLRRLAQR